MHGLKLLPRTIDKRYEYRTETGNLPTNLANGTITSVAYKFVMLFTQHIANFTIFRENLHSRVQTVDPRVYYSPNASYLYNGHA